MKIGFFTSFLVLFGPTTLFLCVVPFIAASPWVFLFLGISAGVLNTVGVVGLALSEHRWPANLGMRRNQNIMAKIQENGAKVIGLTYLSALLGWGIGHGLNHVAGLPLLPAREWVVVQALVGLFIVDFWDYWAHRLQHHVEWLWQRHAVHHAVLEFSIFGAAKIHWLDTPFVVFPGFIMLGLCGVGAVPAATTMIAWFALTTMLHANAKLSLGVLDHVIQVPSVHHRHHEVGFDNATGFGGVFCLFDRLFGTHQGRGDFEVTVGLGPRHP